MKLLAPVTEEGRNPEIQFDPNTNLNPMMMKNNFFKIVVPAFAILVAIAVSAFTTLDNTNVKLNDITGYVMIPGQPCDEVDVECSLEGEDLCESGSKQVFANLNNTSCENELFKN